LNSSDAGTIVYLCHGNYIVVSDEPLESNANLLEFLNKKQNETTIYTNCRLLSTTTCNSQSLSCIQCVDNVHRMPIKFTESDVQAITGGIWREKELTDAELRLRVVLFKGYFKMESSANF